MYIGFFCKQLNDHFSVSLAQVAIPPGFDYKPLVQPTGPPAKVSTE